MYFDSYITGKRIQQLRKTKGLTQEQFAATGGDCAGL